MTIHPNTPPAEISELHVELLQPFVDLIQSGEIPDPSRLLAPIAALQAHVQNEARYFSDASFRAETKLKAAESRVVELEREIRKLRHYSDVVEAAMADAGESVA